jgi:hypothetical protein
MAGGLVRNAESWISPVLLNQNVHFNKLFPEIPVTLKSDCEEGVTECNHEDESEIQTKGHSIK